MRQGHGGLLMFNERERPVLPAQFAMRVAILCGIALVMFSIIFFRLWYLQVLSSDQYLKQAQNNQVRDVTVQAPRGEILDRNGKVLVDNRTALALQILPTELPQKRHKQRERVRAAEPRDQHAHGPDREADPPADQGPALEPGHAQARRQLRPRLLPTREPGQLPGRHGRARLRAQLPARQSGGADLRLRPRGRRSSSSTSPAIRASSPATRSASRGSRTPTTTSCAESTA